MTEITSWWFYRKWWHKFTWHKTDAHRLPDGRIWYFDRRKKTWHLEKCQWHDVLPEQDCSFCNPVLSETI